MNELVWLVSGNEYDNWAQVTDSNAVAHEWISEAGVWKQVPCIICFLYAAYWEIC